MRKIGIGFLAITIAILCIPILILGGIGPGIKFGGVITKLKPPSSTDAQKSTVDVEKIKVFVKAQNKIVDMKLEDYITGVLAAEMPAKFDLEALKAQAVTARTYAVAKLVDFGGKGCVRHPGADICSEIHCQAWISKAERFKSWKASEAASNWDKIASAVSFTSGQVIAYKDKLASAVKYFSTSDGKTENSTYAFGYTAPYLLSVSSPNEENAPNFKSSVTLSRLAFIERLQKAEPTIKLENKNLASQIRILSWTEGGRVKEIKIGDKTFSGVEIRWAMNLRSADFGILVDGTNVKFNVRGNGHGVGLSQWGANEMGKRGIKYDKIVRHYFTGTEILNISQLAVNKLAKK